LQLKFTIPIYKQAPFVRLLVALVIGILVQWYLPLKVIVLFISFVFLLSILLLLPLVLKQKPIRKVQVQSALLQCLFILLGCSLVLVKDIRNNKNYIGNYIKTNSYKTVLTINEPLSEKAKSYKANGSIISIVNGDTLTKVVGNVIVYFKKDSTPPNLAYGATIITNKALQPIKNSGNPGAFNYEQQSLFSNNNTYQVFLGSNDFSVLPEKHTMLISSFLFKLRENVLHIIDKNILPEKEKGVAEALLIGYRDDLDKDLVQAYSNTGTIHVIAISGLHLGFIYLVLVLLFKPFENKKYAKWIIVWLKPIMIITVLWIFSLLAGAAASILRSAIMFTCIVIGDSIGRKTSIYNSLAASAFIVLCINPFNLWDVGFQLSYAAVLSIVVFMQPIYKLFYIKNKALDWLWKLNAVTFAAQIFTIPIVIYHFHQFPNLFLITNIVAVPLSTIILGGELLLLALSWWPSASLFIGKLCTWAIWCMDSYMEWCNSFSFAITDYLKMGLLQCYLFFAIIIAIAYWLLQQYKKALFYALGIVILFLGLNAFNTFNINKQKGLVVYNVPQQQAIDFVNGNSFSFIGDSALLQNGFLKNFHIKPSRIEMGTNENEQTYTYKNHPFYSIANKNILLMDDQFKFCKMDSFKSIDVMVLSKNPKLYLDSITQTFTIIQIVADASNPAWKVKLWQKDCERLQIPFYNTNERGAFVINF
jgi:competence protein ComEC